MFTEVAKSAPFEGAPVIHSPSIIGAQPGRFMRYRIPVTGQRPIVITADGLPEGITLTDAPYQLVGTLDAGNYDVKITATNALGTVTKPLTIEVADDNVPRSPLMGWTSWNAYYNIINQDKILDAARILDESGLADYGYAYINIDSGWQGEYGGRFGGIMANEFFPDMYALVDGIHARGLKAGIYSSPMMINFGWTKYLKRDYIGTTSGDIDRTMPDYDKAGVIHHENECARQFADWGFDYLKYDWNPARMYHLAPMKRALLDTGREFTISTTCYSDKTQIKELMAASSSVRDNHDSYPRWDIVTGIIESTDPWIGETRPRHFFDTDMLDTGVNINASVEDEETTVRQHLGDDGRLYYTEDETVFVYTMRAILTSPIQLSCELDKMTEFEYSVYTNDEVIAVNQDSLCSVPLLEQNVKDGDRYVRVYRKKLENGDDAVAIFNIGETEETVTVPVSACVRDLWAKKDIHGTHGEYTVTLPPRTVKLIRTGE